MFQGVSIKNFRATDRQFSAGIKQFLDPRVSIDIRCLNEDSIAIAFVLLIFLDDLLCQSPKDEFEEMTAH